MAKKTEEKDPKAAAPAPATKAPAAPDVVTLPPGQYTKAEIETIANEALKSASGAATALTVMIDGKEIDKAVIAQTDAGRLVESDDGFVFRPAGATPLAPAEDLSDLPEAVQMAIPCFGLKRAHVLGHRLTEDGCVIITRGGRKLHWPGDEEKAAALTETDKDGIPRKDFPPANLFGKRG